MRSVVRSGVELESMQHELIRDLAMSTRSRRWYFAAEIGVFRLLRQG
jgi:hypothetical protein